MSPAPVKAGKPETSLASVTRTISEQTKHIDNDVLAAARRQLGRNFVTLICGGSRASGDELPDSDYDAACFVHDVKKAGRLELSALEKRHGVRIGVSVKSWAPFADCVRHGGSDGLCCGKLLGLRLGRERVVGGRVPRPLPAASRLLRADWRREMQLDWWAATLPDLPSNVLRREPRRQVGFIIAICDSLLVSKGVAVRKEDLPRAIRRYHPKFHVVGLLRQALRRRKSWPRVMRDRRELNGTKRDVKRFLAVLRRYAFTGGPGDMTEAVARRRREEAIAWWTDGAQ